MPNWAYNEIFCKDQYDFMRTKEVLLNDGDVDFNRIRPMPKGLNRMPGTGSDSHLKAIAVHLDLDQNATTVDACNAIHAKYTNVSFVGKKGNIGPLAMLRDSFSDTPYQIDIAVIQKMLEKHKQLPTDIERQRYESMLKASPGQDMFPSYEEYGKNALRLLLKTGHTDWYGWSIQNWGTKWNACQTCVNDESMSIYFETAWSPAVNLMCELSEKLGIQMYVRYSEEQFSAMAGEYVFENGKYVDGNDCDDDKSMFCVACDMQDPDQMYHRYDETNGEILYNYDDDENDPEWKLFDAHPKIYTSSGMYANFMANAYTLEDE